MKLHGMAVVTFAVVLGTVATAQRFNYSGTVTDRQGAPITHALVTLPITGAAAETDAAGKYTLAGEIASVRTLQSGTVPRMATIRRGAVEFTLPQATQVMVRVMKLNGTSITIVPARTFPGGQPASIRFDKGLRSGGMYLVEFVNGAYREVFTYIPVGSTFITGNTRQTSRSVEQGAMAAASVDPAQLLRASAAGFLSRDTISAGLSGAYNFILDPLVNDGRGTAGQQDGSLDRLIHRGTIQYFWGDPGDGTRIPLVKVVTAVGSDAVDIALIFNPNFVDNTYGTNTIGWNKHTFTQLVKSDHVQLAVRNKDGDIVFAGKLDLISVAADAPSGYAALGPYGGDGELTTGSKEDILSFGTSMDDNLNYFGYELFENSPKTDSVYAPDPAYPNWEYYAIYRISFDPEMFGASGYGDVQMTSVHASPAKTPNSTITVTEDGPPSDPDDPFTHTHFDDPPTDRTGNPDQPPTDATDEANPE